MTLKNRVKNAFPGLYQRFYEWRTDRLIAQNRFVSAEEMAEKLTRMYQKRIGEKLSLDPPRSYTEKIQWRKLHGLLPVHSELSDKYAVRKWVASRIGEEYLIPLLGVWESFEEIPFDDLPDSFVLKTNNASGTNLIVKNKAELNYKLAKRKFDYWMRSEYWLLYGYEIQYKAIRPRIIAEAYITDTNHAEDLLDYKFLCFNGKVEFIWVDIGRYHDHRRNVYYPDWTPAPFHIMYPNCSESIAKPENLEEMITLAQNLAKGFDHVRVDLYNTDRIYFGEMTFTSESGFGKIIPNEWDEKLGDFWDISYEQAEFE